MNLGDFAAARREFEGLLARNPGDIEANTALAAILLEQGEPAEALAILDEVLRVKPDFANAIHNRAVILERLGDWRGAAAAYRAELALPPANPESALTLAWILATGPDLSVVDGEEAVGWAQLAAPLLGARALEVLAAAYARNGDYEEAVRWQQEAIGQARTPEQRALFETRLALFASGKPYTRAP
jgi:tetratricopeptide (TPR) repeat protein